MPGRAAASRPRIRSEFASLASSTEALLPQLPPMFLGKGAGLALSINLANMKLSRRRSCSHAMEGACGDCRISRDAWAEAQDEPASSSGCPANGQACDAAIHEVSTCSQRNQSAGGFKARKPRRPVPPLDVGMSSIELRDNFKCTSQSMFVDAVTLKEEPGAFRISSMGTVGHPLTCGEPCAQAWQPGRVARSGCLRCTSRACLSLVSMSKTIAFQIFLVVQ